MRVFRNASLGDLSDGAYLAERDAVRTALAALPDDKSDPFVRRVSGAGPWVG